MINQKNDNKKLTIGILWEYSDYNDVRYKILFDLSEFFTIIVFAHEKKQIDFSKQYPQVTVVPIKFFGLFPFFGFGLSNFSPMNIKSFSLSDVCESVLRCDIMIMPEVYSSYSYSCMRQVKKIKPSILCIPLVYETLSNHLTRYLPPYVWYQQKVVKHADAFWALTDRTGDYLHTIGVPREKIFRVYQGIVLPDRSVINERKTSDTIKILFCGRLAKEKGIDEMVRAFDVLSRKYSHIELNICGEGPLHDSIVALRNPRIILRGFVSPEKMNDSYRDADIFCLMSRDLYRFFFFRFWEEQFGNVLIEAMAYGLPLVTSGNGAIPEIVGSQNLVALDSVELEKALERFILDAPFREKTGLENRTRTETLFSLSQNTRLLAQELTFHYHRVHDLE